MIPADYFLQRTNPSFNSPVGKIMRNLDIIYPHKTADELRKEANSRITTDGGWRIVLTPEEKEIYKARTSKTESKTKTKGENNETYRPNRKEIRKVSC